MITTIAALKKQYSDYANPLDKIKRDAKSGDYMVKIATKEKAICGSLSKWRVVKNINELKELLFIDKRIDEDEFETCDFKLLTRLASLCRKTNLYLLLKLIKKEYARDRS